MPFYFDDAIRDKTFWVWLNDADRNVRRTAELLMDNPVYLADASGELPEKTPAFQTIDGWRREDAWDIRAQEELAASAPSKYVQILGRKLIQSEKQQEYLDQLFYCGPNGEPHPRFRAVSPDVLAKLQLDAIKHTENVLGHGVIGQRFGKPELTAPEQIIDTTGKSPLELAEENARKAQGE